jgi:CHAT domain-containing protein/Tfp pilus assembly protein PilF
MKPLVDLCLVGVASLSQAEAYVTQLYPVRVGERVSGVLAREESAVRAKVPSRFELTLQEAGPITVLLESFDFDVLLRVENRQGELLAQDDDSGIETDARVVLTAETGDVFVVVASSKEGGGAFSLSIQAGEPPQTSSAELLDMGSAWRRTAAERALAREDRRAAAGHRLAEGNRRFSRRQFQEAREAYETSLALARELHDLGSEAAATINIGNVFNSLGDYARARAQYEEGLRAAREAGHRRWEAIALGNLGSVSLSIGSFAQALEYLEQALPLSRELGDRALEARVLKNLANACKSLGDPSRALENLEASIALSRELGDRRLEASALGSLGTIYFSLGDYSRAREHHERHLAIARELGDRVEEASALNHLGNVCDAIGDYSRALECHERSLALDRELGNKPAEVGSLAGLGNTLQALGDEAQARERYETLLVLARELGDREAERAALLGLGNVSFSLGDYASAREYYEPLLALCRESGDRAGESATLGNLGSVLHALRDYRGAREYFEQQLVQTRELGDRKGEARALGNLGNVSYSVGAYRRADELCGQSVDLAREIGDRAQETSVLKMLASVRFALGDFRRARDQYERSLALSRESGDLQEQALALAGIGRTLEALGDPGGARKHLEESLALSRQLGDRSGEARALGSLAGFLDSSGDSAGAQACYEQQLSHSREFGDRLGEAAAIGGLGIVSLSRGDVDRALECFERWRTLSRDVGDCAGEARALGNLGVLYVARRDFSSASEALEGAEKLVEMLSGGGLEQDETSGLRGCFEELGRTAQDLTWLRTREAGEDTRAASLRWGFAAAGRWKGRALLEGIAEHRAGGRSALTIELRRARYEALGARAAILERVSRAVHDGEPAEEVDRLRGEAHAKLAEAARLAERLGEVSPRDAALDLPQGMDPEEVQRAVLGPRDLLVEYVEGKEHLYAYALGVQGLWFHDLGERDRIAAELERFLNGIRDIRSLAGPGEIARVGRVLHGQLLAPVLAIVDEPVDRLVIIPCAPVAALPFEALVIGNGNEEPASFDELVFLIDRYEVTYGPSSAVLAELAYIGPRKDEGKVLLLADPLYGPEARGFAETVLLAGSRARPDPVELLRLPGTREEVLAIADIMAGKDGTALEGLRSLRSGSLEGPHFDLHLGSAASRARFGEDLRRYSILHVACHGFVDAAIPQQTGVALAASAGDDGWFSVQDALELDLDCDLVVLSACDTARGEVKAGEGVESLARAFLYAGTRSIVASLWRVSDCAAAETMRAFYEGALERNLACARALREAKLSVRRGEVDLGPARSSMGLGVDAAGSQGAESAPEGHPFFWAPFIHIGLVQSRAPDLTPDNWSRRCERLPPQERRKEKSLEETKTSHARADHH